MPSCSDGVQVYVMVLATEDRCDCWQQAVTTYRGAAADWILRVAYPVHSLFTFLVAFLFKVFYTVTLVLLILAFYIGFL